MKEPSLLSCSFSYTILCQSNTTIQHLSLHNTQSKTLHKRTLHILAQLLKYTFRTIKNNNYLKI